MSVWKTASWVVVWLVLVATDGPIAWSQTFWPSWREGVRVPSLGLDGLPGEPVAGGVVLAGHTACESGPESGACGDGPCGVGPVWQHRSGVFGDFLYLRPGNVDVIYAREQTSFDPLLASPTGPVGRAAIDGGAGFRVGARWAWDDCTSIEASYTWFRSDTSSSITANPGTVLDMTVAHPSVATSGANSLVATADYDIGFQIVDIDYRGLLVGDFDGGLDYTAGVRYVRLTQDFRASQEIFAGSGLTTVATQIGFDGVGLHFGLDGIKRRPGSGWLLYAKGDASFLAGEFRARYRQSNQFGGAGVIGNDLADFRVVTILETELGVGWESSDGRWRWTAGYVFVGWLNALTTGTYIDGVRNGTYTDLGETLTFDGLTTRIEWRF